MAISHCFLTVHSIIGYGGLFKLIVVLSFSLRIFSIVLSWTCLFDFPSKSITFKINQGHLDRPTNA